MKQSTLTFANHLVRRSESLFYGSGGATDRSAIQSRPGQSVGPSEPQRPSGGTASGSGTKASTSADDRDDVEVNSLSLSLTKQQPNVSPEKSLCHHHGAASGADRPLHCTVRKSNGTRCEKRYCNNCLGSVYDQDATYILLRGKEAEFRHGMDHVFEYDYVWACPSCRGQCRCAHCSDAQRTKRTKTNAAGDFVDLMLSDEARGEESDEIETSFDLQSTPRTEDQSFNLESGRELAERTMNTNEEKPSDDVDPNTMKRKRGRPKGSKSRAKDTQPTIVNLFAKVAQGLTLAPSPIQQSAPSSLPFATGRPIVPPPRQTVLPNPPKNVEKPVMKHLKTRLPLPNIVERIGLYEALVRFDHFNVPKKTLLDKLDRFDFWTEAQLHAILAKLVCQLANVKTLRQTSDSSRFAPLLAAMRGTGIHNGKPWEMARIHCLEDGIQLTHLADVELLPEQVASSTNEASGMEEEEEESLLSRRNTSSRRTASSSARLKLRSMVNILQDDESEDDEDGSGDDGKESDDASDSDDEEDAHAFDRSTGRDRMSSSELSSESDDEGKVMPKRSARLKTKDFAIVLSSAEESDLDSDSEQDTSAASSKRPSPILRKSTRQATNKDNQRLAIQTVDPSRKPKAKPKMSPNLNGDDQVLHKEPAPPLPPFEQRIAILSGLVVMLLQTREARKELEDGVRDSRERRREAREEEREKIKEHTEEMLQVRAKRMEMRQSGKSREWKQEYDELVRKHTFALLDLRVDTYVFCEARKSRAEPLGQDADGNEYWQLSECAEEMPYDTEGHWAWSLLVFGSRSFWPQEEATEEKDAAASAMQIDGEQSSRTAANGEEGTHREGDAREVFCTNQVDDLQRLRKFIRYRLEMAEYEVKKLRATRHDELARLEFEVASGLGSSTMEDVNVQKSQWADERAMVSAKQQARKANVEVLLSRLREVQQYYEWHRVTKM